MISLEKKLPLRGFQFVFHISTITYSYALEGIIDPVKNSRSIQYDTYVPLVLDTATDLRVANDCRHSKGNFTIGYTFARDEY